MSEFENAKSSVKTLGIMGLLMSLLVASSAITPSANVIRVEQEGVVTTHSKLEEVYRQDEKLVVHSTIFNNQTEELNVTSLWLLLTRKIEEGPTPAPEKRQSRNVSYLVSSNETQTMTISLSLNDVSPATYNVTNYFEVGETKYYVMQGEEIKVRSSLHIPPGVWVIMGITLAGILMFIAYYISGKIR
ncbi:MAG: hypothetical protein GWO20_08380 [Candidatus Korarchaeota archaeon]|nr:hypothetical protein [Candidatus Korarchaeota archaeon]NIU82423.1 hypothetical protein [Candidatus Thorarchaeota archaeon]NIW13229.1 hypothetical protein [Candidatus Thorarchaeota archaeon]NIW51359.1 hypothetical protein [Candidatus Korarchaeota archaeon]